MRRAINLADHLRKRPVGSSSSFRGLLINIPMLVNGNVLKSHGISSVPSISTSGQHSKIFVSYHIYKGRGAICIEPIAPEFCPLSLNPGSIRISKVGSVHLQFAHSVGERKYDWKKKQTFALSATELGSLISLSPNESCEFFHDPFIGKSDAGKVHKVLQISPLPSPPGYFFRLKVSNKTEQIEENFVVPITKAEFTVMRSSFDYFLPYIMGWHAVANSNSHALLPVFVGKSEMAVSSDLG